MENKTKTKATKTLISDEEFDRQYEAAERFGKENPRMEPRATSVESAGRRITIEIESGWSFSFDPRIIPELQKGTDRAVTDVRLRGAGYTLEWTTLDIHLGVGTIIAQLLGEPFWRHQAARITGSAKSARKASASAANGKLGGRPRKAAAVAEK